MIFSCVIIFECVKVIKMALANPEFKYSLSYENEGNPYNDMYVRQEIEDFVNVLYRTHPEWFQTFDHYKFDIVYKGTTSYKREGLDKLQTLVEYNDRHSLVTYMTPNYTTFNKSVPLQFQFSEQADHIVQLHYEQMTVQPIEVNKKPYFHKKWNMLFKKQEHVREFAKLFCEWSVKMNMKEGTGLSLWISSKNGWCLTLVENVPSMDHIFLKKETKQMIIDKIENWTKLSDRAIKFGKPRKLNILLHGVPGSGKTSIVKALAKHFKKQLFICSFSKELNDTDLQSLFEKTCSNSIMVMEDIDAFFVQRESKCQVSFSTLLNILDGVQNVDKNMITILTANHPEALDPALIRPGRIDLLVKFDYPEQQEICDAFTAFTELPAETVQAEFKKFYKHIKGLKLNMSLITDYLFNHPTDYLKCIEELLKHHDSIKDIVNDKSEKMYM